MYADIADASQALTEAEQDIANDFGEEAVEQAHRDTVLAIAAMCPPGVAAELIRREL